MKNRILLWIGATIVALAIGGGCLVSDLDNSFDLKGPKGIAGYLGGLIQQTYCRFDSPGKFDSCTFGP